MGMGMCMHMHHLLHIHMHVGIGMEMEMATMRMEMMEGMEMMERTMCAGIGIRFETEREGGMEMRVYIKMNVATEMDK